MKPKESKSTSTSTPLIKHKTIHKKLEISKSSPIIPTTASTQNIMHKTPRPINQKKTISISLVQKQPNDEEEEPLRKQFTLAEKRAQQAKRAYQIKIWRVREEREARQARSLLRKKLMSGERKKEIENNVVVNTRKGVRFNLKKNKIIQITENE